MPNFDIIEAQLVIAGCFARTWTQYLGYLFRQKHGLQVTHKWTIPVSTDEFFNANCKYNSLSKVSVLSKTDCAFEGT